MNSVKNRLLRLLENGTEVTTSRGAVLLGTTPENIARRVYDLRREGYSIYANRDTNFYGNSIVKYRMGQPSRAMVAAAFRAFGRKATDANVVLNSITFTDRFTGDRVLVTQ